MHKTKFYEAFVYGHKIRGYDPYQVFYLSVMLGKRMHRKTLTNHRTKKEDMKTTIEKRIERLKKHRCLQRERRQDDYRVAVDIYEEIERVEKNLMLMLHGD